MIGNLLQNFITNEELLVLFQIHPLKASGLDGLFAHYFQKHWNIVGPNVTKASLDS